LLPDRVEPRRFLHLTGGASTKRIALRREGDEVRKPPLAPLGQDFKRRMPAWRDVNLGLDERHTCRKGGMGHGGFSHAASSESLLAAARAAGTSCWTIRARPQGRMVYIGVHSATSLFRCPSQRGCIATEYPDHSHTAAAGKSHTSHHGRHRPCAAPRHTGAHRSARARAACARHWVGVSASLASMLSPLLWTKAGVGGVCPLA